MPHSVDVYVGQRVRQRRWMLGMTQQQLCDRVGIKFQQIEKYEAGANRISVSLIRHIAAAMEMPVTYFFERPDGQVPDTGKAQGDILTDKESRGLVSIYYAIPESRRRRLFDLAGIFSAAP